ncbi:hypothetical protein MTO96_044758 [Rhipicephalus appendiculatus]
MELRPLESEKTASSLDAYLAPTLSQINQSFAQRQRVRVPKGQCASTPVNSGMYKEVGKLLEEHYTAHGNQIAASHALFVRKQGENQTMADSEVY